MASHISLLENGGTVLVVGGSNRAWQTFKDNPRVIFWSGEQKEVARMVRARSIPQNCRAVIISRFISHTELGYILQDVRARRLTLFANKADGEVTELLDDMLKHVEEVEGRQEEPSPKQIQIIQPLSQLPLTAQEHFETQTKSPEPIQEIIVAKRQVTKKGELNKVLQFVDWNKSNAENARALMDSGTLKRLEIKSTFGSLAQFLRVQRHKLGKPNVEKRGNTGVTKPRKATKKEILTESWGTELDVTVQMFDKLLEEMKEIRMFLVKTTHENNELKKQIEKVKPLLDVIKGLK